MTTALQTISATPQELINRFRQDTFPLRGVNICLVVYNLPQKIYEEHEKACAALSNDWSDQQKIEYMNRAIASMINRILLPLGKVLQSVDSEGQLTLRGDKDQKRQRAICLYGSTQDLILRAVRGNIRTRTETLREVLREWGRPIVLEAHQWLFFEDIKATPILAKAKHGEFFIGIPQFAGQEGRLQIYADRVDFSIVRGTDMLAIRGHPHLHIGLLKA